MGRRRKYESYDLDDTFDIDIDSLDETEKKQLLESGRVQWIYAVRTITSGRMVETEIYPEFTRVNAKRHHVRKCSRKAQHDLNRKNAVKKLSRLLNCNFDTGDIWLTLTYDNDHLPESYEIARRNMASYMRKVNRRRKKLGLENARYIYVTEEGRGRYHHHVVIDGDMSMDEYESLWTGGRRNNARRIDASSGLDGLASYMAKENRRTHGPDRKSRRMWNASKGLRKPKVRKHHQISMKRVRRMVQENDSRTLLMLAHAENARVQYVQRWTNAYNSFAYFYVKQMSMRR